jgi:hypothetical protein
MRQPFLLLCYGIFTVGADIIRPKAGAPECRYFRKKPDHNPLGGYHVKSNMVSAPTIHNLKLCYNADIVHCLIDGATPFSSKPLSKSLGP